MYICIYVYMYICIYVYMYMYIYIYISLGIQSPCQMMIGVYNHLLSKVFRFHYHSQKVIGSLGYIYIYMVTPQTHQYALYWYFPMYLQCFVHVLGKSVRASQGYPRSGLGKSPHVFPGIFQVSPRSPSLPTPRKITSLVRYPSACLSTKIKVSDVKPCKISIIGFLRVPRCPRGGGNSGTLRIPAGKIGEP